MTELSTPARPLKRHERAIAYALAGWCMEIAFTALDGVRDPRSRSAKLAGHTYLWMLPIYAMSAPMFEPVHEEIRHRPWWQRAALYSAGIMAVEYATGRAIRRCTGVVPWDYTGQSKMVIGEGATRLDYAPLWAVAGLGLERIHDGLRRVRVG